MKIVVQRYSLIIVLCWVVLCANLSLAQAQSTDQYRVYLPIVTGVPVSISGVYSCSDITEIPARECQALQAFVVANPDAEALAGWFKTNTPCGWWGVYCGSSPKTVNVLVLTGYDPAGIFFTHPLTTLPAEIGDLPQLIGLDLSHNELTSLPAEIGNLSQLTRLYLTSNELTGLPAEIGDLSQLTILLLQHNQLTVLPTEIGDLSQLTELSLQENQLTVLPAEIGDLSQLTMLYLGYNQLTELPLEIGNLSQLTMLSLQDNQLTVLPTEIGNLSQLTRLGLSNNLNLSGSVPNNYLNLPLTGFFINNTQVCVPDEPTFQSWIASILDYNSSGVSCP